MSDRSMARKRKVVKRRLLYDEGLVRRIRRDPLFTADYVNAVLKNLDNTDEPRVILIALRHLAKAYGMDEIAKAAGLRRESLYRALSAKGNPFFSTFYAVVKAVGLKLTIEPVKRSVKREKSKQIVAP